MLNDKNRDCPLITYSTHQIQGADVPWRAVSFFIPKYDSVEEFPSNGACFR